MHFLTSFFTSSNLIPLLLRSMTLRGRSESWEMSFGTLPSPSTTAKVGVDASVLSSDNEPMELELDLSPVLLSDFPGWFPTFFFWRSLRVAIRKRPKVLPPGQLSGTRASGSDPRSPAPQYLCLLASPIILLPVSSKKFLAPMLAGSENLCSRAICISSFRIATHSRGLKFLILSPRSRISLGLESSMACLARICSPK